MVPRTENTRNELVRALDQSGVPSRLPRDGDTVEIAGADFEVKPLKAVREKDAVLLAHLHEVNGRRPTVIVADRISEEARAVLSRAGLAWLDRRGHLWVRADGVFINADVTPAVVMPPRRVVQVLKGAGMDVALALLAEPDAAHGVHQLARVINRSPGRVSEILTELRAQGLVGTDNRPFVPELFWTMAEEWRPRWLPMPEAPPPEPPDRYRLTGTLGAVALGAPLVTRDAANRPRLYVADDTDLATILGTYGAESGRTASEIAMCPSRFGFTWVSDVHRDGYIVANHVVVALDLAQDRARGREVLESWHPRGVTRVW